MTSPTTGTADIETKPTRRGTAQPKVRRVSAWKPDVRWAHPLEAAMWCYSLALVVDYPLFGIPPWALVLVGPIGALIGVGRARRAWPEHEFGTALVQSMSGLAVTASFAAAAWLVYACWTSPLRAVGWLALALVLLGGWYWVLRTSAPRRAARVVEERERAQMERATATWKEIFEAARLPLRVVETRPTRAGYVVAVEPVDDRHTVTFEALESAIPALTAKAASLLAREGITLGAGAIRPERTEAAHVHLIHVCTRQVLRESIPFEPFEQAPATIRDPIDIGLYEDGSPVALTFGGAQGGVNGKIVGATGSGKSRCTNAMIGRLGECGDVLIGVVASNKLVPLVYPWIKPWLEGKTDRPAIDFVAGQDPNQVLLMMAAIYQIVCWRNAQLSDEDVHVPTPQAPAIVLFIEESGKMADRRETVTLHDGTVANFSKLLHMIMAEDRSSQVSLIPLNQTDLYGSLGEYGSEIARNTPLRICLKTLAPQDGMSVLPGLKASYTDTSKLQHNSMLVQPSIEDPRVMPAKAYNLGGAEIAPIAERNARWRPDLEPELVDVLGELWTGRWDAERLPELATAARRNGLEWPVGQPNTGGTGRGDMGGIDDTDRALWDMIDREKARDQQQATPSSWVPQQNSGDGEGGWPDAEKGVAELAAAANLPAITLPEPLHSVIKLLGDPQAPKDFISTRQLAILLDRVPADASDEELREAARKLGRELAAIDDEIRSEQRGRLQGFDVPKLKQVAARIAKNRGAGQ